MCAENSGIAIRVHRNRDRKAWVSVETCETMFGGVARGSRRVPWAGDSPCWSQSATAL